MIRLKKRKTQLYPIVIECMAEGGYYAECPILPGCHVEGETYAEAVENLEEAILIFLDSYRELGKLVPQTVRVDRDVVVSSSLPIPVVAGA